MSFSHGSRTDMTDTFYNQRSKTQTALLASGFGGVLFVLTYLVLGVLAPGYDGLQESISAIEFTSWSPAQRINFLVFGVMLSSFTNRCTWSAT
jgi:hypothetical protein